VGCTVGQKTVLIVFFGMVLAFTGGIVFCRILYSRHTDTEQHYIPMTSNIMQVQYACVISAQKLGLPNSGKARNNLI